MTKETAKDEPLYDAYLKKDFRPLLKAEPYANIEAFVLDTKLPYVRIIIVKANSHSLAQ